MNSANKVVLLGDSGVGKSTLVNTLCGNFNSRPQSTIGCAIQIHAHQYATGTPEERCELIELWDIGGSPVHRQSCNVFLDTIAGVIFVHDLSNIRSEQNLAIWFDILYTHRMLNMQANLSSSGTRSSISMDSYSSPNVTLLGSDVEKCGTLPTLIVGSRLDMTPRCGRDQQRLSSSSTIAAALKSFESVFLDTRKEITPGSTNCLMFSRFFDAVIEKSRAVEDRLSYSQPRRRRLI